LNEAFLIDTATRERLVAADPICAEIIKPYLRGQDIDRWTAPDTGLFMIVVKSSGDHPWPWANATDEAEAERIFRQTFPSLHALLKPYEEFIDPQTGKKRGLRIREDVGRYWWELRPCAYYEAFDRAKIVYQEISWTQTFAIDTAGRYVNNTSYFLPCGDAWLITVLNAPIGRWFSWRRAQHGKDEALRYFTSFVERYPVPRPLASHDVSADVLRLAQIQKLQQETHAAIADWLIHEFAMLKLPAKLSEATQLDGDAFVTAIRSRLPKKTGLSAAQIARLRKEHADTIEPARLAAAEALKIERRLSDLVNAAFGLTPEEVELMWVTAPPRMPFGPPGR
jgi:hypothetical protein